MESDSFLMVRGIDNESELPAEGQHRVVICVVDDIKKVYHFSSNIHYCMMPTDCQRIYAY